MLELSIEFPLVMDVMLFDDVISISNREHDFENQWCLSDILEEAVNEYTKDDFITDYLGDDEASTIALDKCIKILSDFRKLVDDHNQVVRAHGKPE